jgi:hypothetical protein
MLYGTYPFDEAGSREIAAQHLRRACNILSPPLHARVWVAWLIPGRSRAIAGSAIWLCVRPRPCASDTSVRATSTPRRETRCPNGLSPPLCSSREPSGTDSESLYSLPLFPRPMATKAAAPYRIFAPEEQARSRCDGRAGCRAAARRCGPGCRSLSPALYTLAVSMKLMPRRPRRRRRGPNPLPDVGPPTFHGSPTNPRYLDSGAA